MRDMNHISEQTDLSGLFAVSRAGHDKGQIYIIIRETEEYVYVADGKSRTIEKPKRKNKKHIQIIRRGTAVDLQDKLRRHQTIYNEEIKHAVKIYARES